MRISDIENPTVSYSKGNSAPVQQEHNEPCTQVIGTVPEALSGAFPVARIVMPARVPFGFHSAWVDETSFERLTILVE